MISPRAVQLTFGSIFLFFLFTVFSHGSRDTALSGNPRPSGAYEGLRYRISSHLKPFFGSKHSWLTDHLRRSEEIYQKMVAQRAILAQDYPLTEEKKLFPADTGAAYWKMPFTIWDFASAAFNCPHSMQRLGRLGDGGKWLCGLENYASISAKSYPDERPNCVIYSFGIQAESSFEEELLQSTRGCEIWGYDFSVTKFGPQLSVAESRGRAHFTQAGIAGTTDETKTPPFYSIQDLMMKNGHDHIDILKVDIEGYEFETMKSVIEAFTSIGDGEIPISQFLVEIHLDPGRIKNADEFMGWWVMLEDAGFRPVWTEPNLLVSTIPLHDAKPRYSEYTFINIKDSKSVLLKGAEAAFNLAKSDQVRGDSKSQG